VNGHFIVWQKAELILLSRNGKLVHERSFETGWRKMLESANTENQEEGMHFHSSRARICAIFLPILVMAAMAARVHVARAQSNSATPSSEGELISQFRHVEVASVSDAIEQIMGKRMYMSHHMQPIFTSKFAGYARTVQLKKDEGNKDPEALTGMLQAIDEGATDAVYVMVVEDGEDIAGMGGLMGTAMAARGYAGAVIDGGVRDVAYLRKIGFPVFATGIVPSTSVHHYKFGGAQIPLVCNGVPVSPGDIVVADSDGVVVVPKTQAQAVLSLAQQMDYKEHSMYAVIEQLKSIVQAVKKFGRI
jgi:regulator of RNase E activity RraA